MPNVGDQQTTKFNMKNLLEVAHGMVVAMISIPSCFDMGLEQIELLKAAGHFDNYELSDDGRTLILYFTYLKAKTAV